MISSPQDSVQKADTTALENIESNHEKVTQEVEYTPEELNIVVRKLDFNLMPLCFLLYTFSVLDVSSPTAQPNHIHTKSRSDQISETQN